MKKTFYHYSGIIHVHSTFSDGTLSVPEIASIANELNINFVLITDHNTLQAKREGFEGWYNKILIGIGCELNDEDDLNHYLAFNIEEEISGDFDPYEYVSRVKAMGGFGIIAHPDESRDHIAKYRAYPWKIWDSELFDGIEIWNQMSEWMEGLTHFNKYWRVLHPRRSIIAPKKETLEKWDNINLKRKVVGIGGVDAHGYKYKIFGIIPFTIFRYKISFKTIRTHLLLEEPLSNATDARQDLQKIYAAILKANCYVSHHYFGDASTFRFYASDSQKQVYMGETIAFNELLKFSVFNPQRVTTILIGNGREIDKKEGQEIEFEVPQPGVYRVESWVEQRPWIISNHIRVNYPEG